MADLQAYRKRERHVKAIAAGRRVDGESATDRSDAGSCDVPRGCDEQVALRVTHSLASRRIHTSWGL
jgi:hypothetical protein